jgi:hypothetical protein
MGSNTPSTTLDDVSVTATVPTTPTPALSPGNGSGVDLYQTGPAQSNQFLRKWQLVLIGTGGQWVVSNSQQTGAINGGTITIDDALRITFKTRQTMLETRGTLEVTVYNVARSTSIQQLRNLYNRVILQCGYLNGNFGTIFDGQIIDWRQGREDTLVETYIRIWAMDSDAAYNLTIAKFNMSKGQKVGDAVNLLSGAMAAYGATLGQVKGLSTDPFIRSIVHSGLASDAFKKFGLNTMISNGQLNVAPVGNAFQTGSPVTYNAFSGLIGMAALTGNNGIEFECLLNPNLQVHGIVQIDEKDINQATGPGGTSTGQGVTDSFGPSMASAQIGFYIDPSADGQYELIVIEHHGDSRGNDWATHCYGWPVSVSISSVPSAQQFFQGYGVGPTVGQQGIYTSPPNLPSDPNPTNSNPVGVDTNPGATTANTGGGP